MQIFTWPEALRCAAYLAGQSSAGSEEIQEFLFGPMLHWSVLGWPGWAAESQDDHALWASAFPLDLTLSNGLVPSLPSVMFCGGQRSTANHRSCLTPEPWVGVFRRHGCAHLQKGALITAAHEMSTAYLSQTSMQL